jgi:Bacterial Ig-like domain (group 3)
MKCNFATIFRPSRVSAIRSTSSTRRRTARPALEFLERREVLSTFTWTGTAGDGNWDTGTNWQGGVAPKTGPADLVFQSTTTNQTITLQSDDTGLVVNSLSVQGGNYTLQGPTTNASQRLTLAAGATVSLDSTVGGTLTICTSSAPNSLAPNFLGSTVLNGGGALALNNSTVSYSGNPTSLLTFQVDASNLTFGSSASYVSTLIHLANSGSILVDDGVIPSLGSVNGAGTLQLGLFGNATSSTGLTVNTPSGESDTLAGNVQGPGGTLTQAGAGSLVISRINPVSASNPFVLDVQSGTFGLQGLSNVAHATFSAGSTFSAALNGTGVGQAAKIIASGAASPVNLGGSTLALNLGNGYTPTVGDTFTLISSANGITGHFANAADGQVVFAGGTPFQVNYSNTAVTLKALPATSTQLASSANPSTQGTGVTFTATITSNGSPVPSGIGTVTFFAGATQIGSPVPVGNGGTATSTTISNLPVGGTAITATYSGQVNTFGPSSKALTQTVNAIPPTNDHLVVTIQPPGSVESGSGFGITVAAEDSSNRVDPNFTGTVTVSLGTNPGGGGTILSGTTSLAFSSGSVTFIGLSINNAGSGYTLSIASSPSLTTVTTAPFAVTSFVPPPPPAPVITGESVVFTQKLNKKHKPVGPKTLSGYMITFDTAMNQTALGGKANYVVATETIKNQKVKVGKKTVIKKVPVFKPIGFSVSSVTSNSVTLKLAGKQTFPQGGRLTLVAPGLVNTSGVSLAANGVFTISKGGKKIS